MLFPILYCISSRPTATIIQPSKESAKKLSFAKKSKFKPKNIKGNKRSLQEVPPRKKLNEGAAEEVREVLAGANRRYVGRTVTVMPSDAGVTKRVSSNRFPSTPALPSLVS